MSQSASTTPAKPYTADRREMYAWGIGGICNHALICTFGQVTNIFTLGFGLNPVLVSWAMTLPRAFDAVIDPVLGHLSDNTHTRWGRRKPFLVLGAILGSLFLSAIWWANPHWSETAQFIYLLICAILFYTSWGLYAMAWNAIGYELTDDYHERSRVQGIAGIFLTIVLLGNSWIYWLALQPIFKNEIHGIRWIAGTIAIIAFIAAMVCVSTCKERFGSANPKKNHVALLPAIRATLTNKPFVILLLQRLCGVLGGRVCGGLGGLLGVYYVCGGDKSLSMKVGGISGTLAMVWGLLLMPFMRYFSKLIGKRKAMIMGTGLSFLGTLVAPFVTIPGHPYLPLVPGLIFVPLGIIASTLGDAVLPDICDVDELHHGQRREGLFTAVLAFFSKVEMSVAALAAGYLIYWTGYDAKLVVQPDEVLLRIYALAIYPNIFCTFVGFLLSLQFPLTEASMDEVRQQLDARHAANQVEVPTPTQTSPEPAVAVSAV